MIVPNKRRSRRHNPSFPQRIRRDSSTSVKPEIPRSKIALARLILRTASTARTARNRFKLRHLWDPRKSGPAAPFGEREALDGFAYLMQHIYLTIIRRGTPSRSRSVAQSITKDDSSTTRTSKLLLLSSAASSNSRKSTNDPKSDTMSTVRLSTALNVADLHRVIEYCRWDVNKQYSCDSDSQKEALTRISGLDKIIIVSAMAMIWGSHILTSFP